MSQQTAIKWLINQVEDNMGDIPMDIQEQAKQMEKQQIIKSNRDGVDMVVNKKPFITGEEYYNETYGKE